MEERVYIEYQEKVSRYVHSRISNYHDAEDLVSVVFLKICQKWNTFDVSKAAISTWIYTITANTVKDYYKTHKEYSEIPETIEANGQIDDELLMNETLQELAQALMMLSERERDLVILHFYEGMTLKDVAFHMGMSYSNTKIVHKKALGKLRGFMFENSYISCVAL